MLWTKTRKKYNEERSDFIHSRYTVLTRFIYTFLKKIKNNKTIAYVEDCQIKEKPSRRLLEKDKERFTNKMS